MSARDDANTTISGALDTLCAATYAEGAASRDAEVAGLTGQVTDLTAAVAELKAQIDPYAAFYELEAPSAGVDAGPVIQKALDNYGQIVLGPGDWDSKSGLLCTDGQHIHLHDDATNLWRNYSSGAGTQAAFIRNRDFTKPIQGLSFTGPGNIAARPGMRGCVFGLKVDDLVNDGWGTTYWTKGRHTQSVGNNHRYTNPKPWRCDPTDSSGSGGLRYGGGDGFHAIGLDIWSGDDVIQFVPAGAAGDPLLNYADVTNAVYENCVGKSYSSRFMVVGLQTDGTVTMTVSINGVTFKGCHGFGGGTGVNIANHAPSSGSIQNVTFVDSSVDQSLASLTLGQPGDVFILRDANTGIVDHIDLSGLTVLNPRDTKSKPLFGTRGLIGSNITAPVAA